MYGSPPICSYINLVGRGAGLTCDEQLDKVYLNTMLLFRRRFYAPLTQAFTGGATAS